jgi:hypothetical protein
MHACRWLADTVQDAASLEEHQVQRKQWRHDLQQVFEGEEWPFREFLDSGDGAKGSPPAGPKEALTVEEQSKPVCA